MAIHTDPQARDGGIGVSANWPDEARATLVLAWPLIITQIAQIAFWTTDVVVMGWLGAEFLAAGALATSLFNPLIVGGFGVVLATSPMVAQAIGARDFKSIRRTVRVGFWAALIVAAVIMPIIWQAEAFLLLVGQDPDISKLSGLFLHYAVWSVPTALLFNVLRSFISAKGNTQVVLVITLACVVLNAFLNYLLVFGNLGFPRLEIVGSGIATSITNLVMFLIALAYAVYAKRYRRHFILVRLWKPDWPRFFEFFRIGLPIGLTLLSEVGLFGVAVLLMGWLGPAEVAGHAIALQCAAITFMVPLGLSQATTIRVGLAFGAQNHHGVALAGWTSLALTLCFMVFTCTAFLLVPYQLATLFLDPGNPENTASIGLAVSYLMVAAAFQFFDGTQVSMAAALRGLSDTRVPMVVALIGYWIVGLGVAYLCGFTLGGRGVGIWIGLAAGLAFVAVVLAWRWLNRERLGLVRHAPLVAEPS